MSNLEYIPSGIEYDILLQNKLDIKVFNEFKERISNTTSLDEKIKILNEYKDNDTIIMILYYTYSPLLKYGISKKTILDRYQEFLEKKPEIEKEEVKEIELSDYFLYLHSFHQGYLTGKQWLFYLFNHIRNNKEVIELTSLIFDRNLKIWLNTQIIKKVFPNLIQEFSVALADKVDNIDKLKYEEYFASRKLDGVRCLIFFNWASDRRPLFYSRTWKTFLIMEDFSMDFCSDLYSAVKDLWDKPFLLDGELCSIAEDWKENFSSIISQVKLWETTLTDVTYYIFDHITEEEFWAKKWNRTFKERYDLLVEKVKPHEWDTIKVLEQKELFSKEDINQIKNEFTTKDWEWLMFRKKNSLYHGKRTKDLLKYKLFHDLELTVHGIETWTISYMKDWKMLSRETMTNVLCMYKDNVISIGSWFTAWERDFFYSKKDLIESKELVLQITVQYFEETKNKEWKYSLRFPTFKWIRDYE